MKTGKNTFEILPQFVDFQSQIKLSSLIELILMSAIYHADENGFGIRNLNEMGATWVISRIALEMKYFPKEYDKITVETWVEEIHTYNTIRNFNIKNEKDELIGQAISVWYMINLESRRPMEIRLLREIDQIILSEKKVVIEKPLKLDETSGKLDKSFQVQYTDIDINRHVNVTHYLDWMVNCFTLDEHKSKFIERLDVNFINEILYNNHVEVYKDEIAPNDFRFEIKAENNTACRGRLKFSSR